MQTPTLRKISSEDIIGISKDKFTDLAMEIFRIQRNNCAVYYNWCDFMLTKGKEPQTLEEIPFLPLSFFKTQRVVQENHIHELIFRSSNTTGLTSSVHYVKDSDLYRQSIVKGFEKYNGDISGYCFLVLLPSNLEREDSSLAFMAAELIKKGKPGSGFYLNEYELVYNILLSNETNGVKSIVLGVTYALLDFSDYLQNTFKKSELKHCIVMETGGMKGKREEQLKATVHAALKQSFGTNAIHSEYGMTELLSQAYSKEENRFFCPEYMKILIQDPTDPGKFLQDGHRGRICIIDLVNIHSCSFLASDDLGIKNNDESFQVIGRLDYSDIRGCNLMVQ